MFCGWIGARRISVFLEDDFRETDPRPGSGWQNDLNLELHTRRLTALHRAAHESLTFRRSQRS